MRQNYANRMMAARDPRFAKIAAKLGYNRRDMQADEATDAPVQTDERTVLREEYKRVLGKKPFGGWDAATLREKIAEAG